MNIDLTEVKPCGGANIAVVGVGGGGNNMIAHLVKTGTYDSIKLIVANTDLQHMRSCPVENKIVLGEKLTKGLGAGMKPEVGRRAAEESFEDIKGLLAGSDIVIISAGLGGGTGTGAAPIIAQAAKDVGALTVAVVTKPFKNEGSKRLRLAEEGLKVLRDTADSIVVIPNEKLMSVISRNAGYKESLRCVDDVLSRAVNGISSIILHHVEDGINVDFADVQTVMSYRGLALMGIGEAVGDNAAVMAVKNAIESPLFDNMSINGSRGVIVNFEMNPDYPYVEMDEAMSIVREAAFEEADIIVGTMPRPNYDVDMIKVSIIATGFEKDGSQPQRSGASRGGSSTPATDLVLHRVVSKVGNGDSYCVEDDLEKPTYQRHMKD